LKYFPDEQDDLCNVQDDADAGYDHDDKFRTATIFSQSSQISEYRRQKQTYAKREYWTKYARAPIKNTMKRS